MLPKVSDLLSRNEVEGVPVRALLTEYNALRNHYEDLLKASTQATKVWSSCDPLRPGFRCEECSRCKLAALIGWENL